MAEREWLARENLPNQSSALHGFTLRVLVLRSAVR